MSLVGDHFHSRRDWNKWPETFATGCRATRSPRLWEMLVNALRSGFRLRKNGFKQSPSFRSLVTVRELRLR